MGHSRRHRGGIVGTAGAALLAWAALTAPPAAASSAATEPSPRPSPPAHAAHAADPDPARAADQAHPADRAALAHGTGPEPWSPEPWSPAPVASTPAHDGRALARTDGLGDFGEESPSPRSTGPLLPVLPLGAGLTSLGLGLAFLALRLRRA